VLSLSSGGSVIVSLELPSAFVGGESEYRCSYRILGLAQEENGRVIGSDSLQALQLALVRIGAILYTSDEWRKNQLSWNGDRNLGFPLPESIKGLQP
jgi:hypothetical protein